MEAPKQITPRSLGDYLEVMSKVVMQSGISWAIVEKIRAYADAGYDHIYVHQVGPDQEGCVRFYQREVMPQLGDLLVEQQRRRRVA